MGWRGLWLLPALLVAGPALAEKERDIEAWSTYIADDARTAVTVLEAGERFGLVCFLENEGCAFFVKMLLPCEDGQRSGVWLEGEPGRRLLQGLCAEGPTGHVFFFDENLEALVQDSTVIKASVARPGGGRKAVNFSTAGALEAMRQVRAAHAETRLRWGYPLRVRRG